MLADADRIPALRLACRDDEKTPPRKVFNLHNPELADVGASQSMHTFVASVKSKLSSLYQARWHRLMKSC